MPSVTLNGTSFAGGVFDSEATPRAPQEVTPTPAWPGDEWRSANGTPIVVRGHSAPRDSWELRWNRVPEATRAAVRAVFNTAGTFSATILGSTFTAQCGNDAYTENIDVTIPGPTYYFNVSLRVDKS